ncbi:dihydrolipoyl dehydrogenase family protein [Allonocardiopsis opalescens]|uniref:Pyruvate/2-oxoglutarate dehydrogenase complex dihydrolipoamide dehydrogenase (E3) component n=1 Tax=Allonocardiopsis opalescens TaxID=1144618 RepID=A0A2T0PTC7_9ACTN|nr:NAD(P)/FAD-dependent oxidoreductase [Allonocardiopsis opalescens]PRX92152.1 pyruvate/2-oxoglutarate dehydrogenase complex dihydrolipoamide dehydrogenase (E3) component [Allonocardiopsis opalescens]
METVDVVVIGMGPGGEALAGRLAEAGLSVVGLDHRLVGGECPYWGCIPSKMMIRASGLLAEARRVPGMAGEAEVRPDWAPVARRIREEATDDWDDRAAVERFEGKGGRFVRGTGRLTGPRTVAVDDGRSGEFTAERAIVVNAGTSPLVPDIPGLAGTPFWTNREALEAVEVPESLAVLGGGPIGLELAQMFARFGCRVTILEAGDRVLKVEEPEASEVLDQVLAADGVAVRTGVKLSGVRHEGGGFQLDLGDDTLGAERLLVATGRRTDLAALGVDRIGLDPDARYIPVDGRLRAAPGVWAVGDITGKGAFTHVSMYQAKIVGDDILGLPVHEAEYHGLPRVTFTDPEIGAAGVTEHQARERGLRVATGYSALPSSSRGFIHKAGNEGFIKLVADADAGVLVGATSAGPSGGEVLSGLAVAVHARVPLERLATMMYAYPTFHRAIEDALNHLG